MKKPYKKPTITNGGEKRNIFPAAAFGMAMALAKGKLIVDATHTQVLNRVKRS